ncbi:MAG TPA: Chromate resistance protein ChrB [Gaiellaceae bacterium]
MASAPPSRWVLLAYRLPREPSTPRIALWRRLRQLGAAQLLDGLVALPLDESTRERFDWLAQEVEDAGGEATVWTGELATAADERALVTRLAEAVAADYRAVIEAAEAARDAPEVARRRTVRRLRRALERIDARDFFPPPERDAARHAVEEIAALVEAPR